MKFPDDFIGKIDSDPCRRDVIKQEVYHNYRVVMTAFSWRFFFGEKAVNPSDACDWVFTVFAERESAEGKGDWEMVSMCGYRCFGDNRPEGVVEAEKRFHTILDRVRRKRTAWETTIYYSPYALPRGIISFEENK
jgi:hypothetical protein